MLNQTIHKQDEQKKNININKQNISEIKQTLYSLIDNYKDNNLVLEKINEYLHKQLPKSLELFIERQNRKEELEKISKQYIDDFLDSQINQYFYIASKQLFIYYNGETYIKISEDTLWHTILSDLSTKSELVPWKHKIKNQIVKKVKKEKSILSTIPESSTIQYIIQNLTPLLFKTKEEVKYFLSILGDAILRKQNNLTYFVTQESNHFLKMLNDHIDCNINIQYLNHCDIKTKFFQHDFKLVRFLTFNASVKIHTCWSHFLKKNILDIIAVSCHYSNVFKSADNYIKKHCKQKKIQNSVLFLDKFNPETLVQKFIKQTLVKKKDVHTKWMDIYYLWKEYLIQDTNLTVHPLLMKDFKGILKNKLKYDAETDRYLNITSPKLSYVKHFQMFWQETVTKGDDEFELSEMLIIYLEWLQENELNEEKENIDEEKMKFLINHFSSFKLEGKIIKNIKCSLWNKQEDMNEVINQLKIDYNFYQVEDMPIYKLYKDYCEKTLESKHQKICSKNYFTNYLSKIIPSQFLQSNKLKKEYWSF